MNFSPKDPDEIEFVGFNFAARLAAGEVIQSSTFHVSVIEGEDPDAAAMLQGAPTIESAIVKQKIGFGVAGVRYKVSAHVETSAGQALVESGVIEVREIG
jgi:hypothetical protein